MKPLLILGITAVITLPAFSQDYTSEVNKASQAYDKNQYDSCAWFFKKAFAIKYGTGSELYNAGMCNAMNKNYKQAFALLNMAVEKGANISKLKIDPELDLLHGEKQWKRLLKKAIRIQLDSFAKTPYPEYAATLADLWEKDQYYRFRLGRAIKNGDTLTTNILWKKMHSADSANGTVASLLTIIDKIGWPTTSKVGKAGASTAFLVIDHSSREIMEKYLPYLEEAAKKGEASFPDFATMKDRVLVNKGRKQIYGTQKYWDAKQNKFVFFPIEDEKRVNELRKEAGLSPLEEFRH